MDREDARELAALEGAKRELVAIMQHLAQARRNGDIIPFAKPAAPIREHAHA